jgi:para-aminobenzoate synthetase component 1
MDAAATHIAAPEAPFLALLDAAAGGPVALLHSCGAGPARLFTGAVDELTLAAEEWPDAWDRLAAFLAAHEQRPCVGYLGYDLRDATEPIARVAVDDFPLPLLHFTAYGGERRWPAAPAPFLAGAPPVAPARRLSAHASRADYEARIAAVIEAIRAGDIFQANLTQPFTGDFDGAPRAAFWRLCAHSPAPFAAYLETGRGTASGTASGTGSGVAVLSSSPEEFLWMEGDAVRTTPIKGTRPRSADPARDRALLAELLASEKDRAELAMIVDLMRNDLGKVAVPGSVRVGPFPEHRSFAQVHHLQTTVSAKLRPAASRARAIPGHPVASAIVDLLRATFPPGSVTGAPKLRCMEILEQLELVRRGVYTGAIGCIGPGPRLHLSVAIRTMVCRGGRVRFNTGGGVTADSTPAQEYEETLHKAAGLVAALQCDLVAP